MNAPARRSERYYSSLRAICVRNARAHLGPRASEAEICFEAAILYCFAAGWISTVNETKH